MKFIREHIIFRFLWLVMALHILNISVDNPDPQPENVPEDLSYNDMESVVEIILEQVLDIDNAITEYDDNDDDDSIVLKKTIGFVCYQQFKKASLPNYIYDTNQTICEYKNKYAFQFHPEITPPPPKL